MPDFGFLVPHLPGNCYPPNGFAITAELDCVDLEKLDQLRASCFMSMPSMAHHVRVFTLETSPSEKHRYVYLFVQAAYVPE